MANVFANPIIIDTANAGPITTISGIKVYKVEWFSPVSVGDAFSVTSGSRTVLEGKCEAAGVSQTWNFERGLLLEASGWGVPTLVSGKLYFWYDIA
jgi:hypothetical protein